MIYSESVYTSFSELREVVRRYKKDEWASIVKQLTEEGLFERDPTYKGDYNIEILRDGGVLFDDSDSYGPICFGEISLELVKIIFDLAIKEEGEQK